MTERSTTLPDRDDAESVANDALRVDVTTIVDAGELASACGWTLSLTAGNCAGATTVLTSPEEPACPWAGAL